MLILKEDGNYYEVEEIRVINYEGNDSLIISKGKRIVDSKLYD